MLDVIRDLDDPVDGTVLTTWHDKEPVDEALDLALMLRPHACYAEGWDAIVIANIGDAADTDELRWLISERVRPSY